MGKDTEEFRGMLRGCGSVPACGYDLDGRRVMEDVMTTVQVGDGAEGTLTFEEGLCGLECLELTPEQAAWLINAPHVRQLLIDALGIVIGWGMKLNEMRGAAPDDVSQYPMATAASLIDRAHNLGMKDI